MPQPWPLTPARAMALDAGTGGDIGKTCGAIVEVECIAASRCRRFEIGAIDLVNIQVAVPFRIQQGTAAALGFDDVLFNWVCLQYAL